MLLISALQNAEIIKIAIQKFHRFDASEHIINLIIEKPSSIKGGCAYKVCGWGS